MNYKDADRMRSFFTDLFRKNPEQYYYAAITQSYPNTHPYDYSIVLYAGHRFSSFLAPLSALAWSISEICNNLDIRYCEYNAGTKEPDMRVAIEIRSLIPNEIP